jgi:hypothetical protein
MLCAPLPEAQGIEVVRSSDRLDLGVRDGESQLELRSRDSMPVAADRIRRCPPFINFDQMRWLLVEGVFNVP